MGQFAYLRIGRRELVSPKYYIPYSWCMIFENTKPTRGIFRLDVLTVKKKLNSAGITLHILEERIAEFTGWPAKHWKNYRRFILTNDHEGLEKQSIQDGLDPEDDDNYQNVLFLLEYLEEDEGLDELVALYRLLLLLEEAKPEQIVRLNIREFRYNYEDYDEVIPEARNNFSDKVSMYNFLFSYTVPNRDQVELMLDKIQELTEDEIIREVLVPLLIKIGYHNVTWNDYHGPEELGVDTQLFYKLDSFEGRFYYAAQVKAINIHTNSRKEGHVDSVAHQLSVALNSKFIDSEDNEEKTPDRVMLVTSGRINDGARRFLHQKFPNRSLVIIDGKKIAESLVKHNLFEKTIQTIEAIKMRNQIEKKR